MIDRNLTCCHCSSPPSSPPWWNSNSVGERRCSDRRSSRLPPLMKAGVQHLLRIPLILLLLILSHCQLLSWALEQQQQQQHPSAGETSLSSSSARPPPPPPIRLNKCCLHGEYLQESKTCMPGSSEHWIPVIYLIGRRKYQSPQGTRPKFITFNNNVLPIAKHPRPSKLNSTERQENGGHDTNNEQLLLQHSAKEVDNETDDDDSTDDVNCNSIDDLELFTGNQNLVIFSNGSLYLSEHSIFVPPHRYCVDRQAALVCFPERRGLQPALKLKKCCGTHGVYDDVNKRCHIAKKLQQERLKLSQLQEDSYQTLYGFPECAATRRSERPMKNTESSTAETITTTTTVTTNSSSRNNLANHYILAGNWLDGQFNKDTGYLYLPRHQLNLSSSEYCLEHVLATQKNANKQKPKDNSNSNNDHGHDDDDDDTLSISDTIKVITCFHHLIGDSEGGSAKGGVGGGAYGGVSGVGPTLNGYDEHVYHEGGDGSIIEIDSDSSRLQFAILRFGIVISVVFLAGTLIACYLMPSIHHVLHWRCQIYYVFCLFMGKLLLAYTLFRKPEEQLESVLCQLVASVMHFFFLAAFFWLNTMCFNIWWTFRDFRPSSLERNQEMLRLRLYSAYAWGIPLIIAAIAACVNLAPDTSLLRPGFGEDRCWFSGERLPIFAYLFGPMGILLCINIILFVSTAHQLTCGLWKRDDVKSTTERTALGKVCLKLVVVMGVTWIADVLSWLIGGPNAAWFFTDLVNAIQGVFIFVVVGCQPQVWSACKRFCCPRSRQEITNTTNGVQHSSSSQGLPSITAGGGGGGGGGGGFTAFSGAGDVTQNTSIGHSTTFSAGAPNSPVTISTITTNSTLPPALQQPAMATSVTASNRPKVPMETVC